MGTFQFFFGKKIAGNHKKQLSLFKSVASNIYTKKT